VWRGQGHKDTIGWMRITCFDTVKVGDIDHGDCVREGRPTWGPDEFRAKYCQGFSSGHFLSRVQFEFRACRARLNY
jgi:hypothetical protein